MRAGRGRSSSAMSIRPRPAVHRNECLLALQCERCWSMRCGFGKRIDEILSHCARRDAAVRRGRNRQIGQYPPQAVKLAAGECDRSAAPRDGRVRHDLGRRAAGRRRRGAARRRRSRHRPPRRPNPPVTRHRSPGPRAVVRSSARPSTSRSTTPTREPRRFPSRSTGNARPTRHSASDRSSSTPAARVKQERHCSAATSECSPRP